MDKWQGKETTCLLSQPFDLLNPSASRDRPDDPANKSFWYPAVSPLPASDSEQLGHMSKRQKLQGPEVVSWAWGQKRTCKNGPGPHWVFHVFHPVLLIHVVSLCIIFPILKSHNLNMTNTTSLSQDENSQLCLQWKKCDNFLARYVPMHVVASWDPNTTKHSNIL